MNRVLKLVAFAGLLTLASCFGQQNSAPSEGANLDDPRIYGNKGGDPIQLPNKYEDSEEVAARAEQIREKLFPTKASQTDNSAMDTTQMNMEEVAVDTTAAAPAE